VKSRKHFFELSLRSDLQALTMIENSHSYRYSNGSTEVSTGRIFAILVLIGWVFSLQHAYAQAAPENAVTKSIVIETLIDGKSELHLRGNTAQWFHVDFAAPGRHPDIDGNERREPTVINDVEWYPVWPDQPDSENRDCSCSSNLFEGVVPLISKVANNFKLGRIESRDYTDIVQYPAAENEFTLIIEFNDNSEDGAGDYHVSLIYSDVFRINAGLNDAWYNPLTSGQGFFVTVFPDIKKVFLAWFTFDTELPPMDATANVGYAGHRWLTAIGSYVDNQAVMNISITTDGIFDNGAEVQNTDPPGSDGTIILTFEDCKTGTVEYDIPSISRQGIVPIQRITNDNVALCQVISGELQNLR
jgi:hypothetical protein